MLTIRYSPQDFSFTSSIPDRIDISTDAVSVKVAVMAGTTTLFDTDLFPYNKIVSLYDLRSIIEEYMKARMLTHAVFVVKANTASEEAMTQERTKDEHTVLEWCSVHTAPLPYYTFIVRAAMQCKAVRFVLGSP
ncbi:hypothetical protein [Leyella stercorea]|uniref:hypothetical protein n=1 Tax=Leyella stercorea TaxID=363265 RepID=UPI002FE1A162